MTFSPGSFVKINDKDPDGAYSLIGIVISHDDSNIQFDCGLGIGIVTAPLSEVVKANKPNNWQERIDVQQIIAYNAVYIPKTIKPKRSKGSNKLNDVINIVRSNSSLSRKQLIKMVVEKVGMTEAGASTYISQARSALK